MDEIESQQQVYHCTLASRLPSIRRHGIMPGRRRLWRNLMGAKLGDTKMVYLFDDFSDAVRWAAHMEWHLEKPAVILVLAAPDAMDRDPNAHMQLQSKGAYLTNQAIPPENIRHVIPLTRELTRQVVNGGTATRPV